jgi:hypothetical protein
MLNTDYDQPPSQEVREERSKYQRAQGCLRREPFGGKADAVMPDEHCIPLRRWFVAV